MRRSASRRRFRSGRSVHGPASQRGTPTSWTARLPSPCRPAACRRTIQAGIIAAVAADDLEHVGVAAFHVARNDAGRPASQHHRPVNSWIAADCHRACLSWGGLLCGLAGTHHARSFAPDAIDPICPGLRWHRLDGVKQAAGLSCRTSRPSAARLLDYVSRPAPGSAWGNFMPSG